MELFKQTNFDFLKWKWHFIGASLVLSVAGLVSLAINGGPKLGIEFKGGMEMTVQFASQPDVEKLRSVMSSALGSPVTVQTFEDRSNEVVIGTEGGSNQLDERNRQLVQDTLAKTYGQPGNGKLDVNNASTEQLASRLTEPLQRAGVQLSDTQVIQLVTAIAASRDKQGGGVLTNLDQLRGTDGLTAQVVTVLNQECYLAPYNAQRKTEIVGPKVGDELRRQAINATLRLPSRYDHYDRIILPVRERDHPDRDCGTADISRLLHE